MRHCMGGVSPKWRPPPWKYAHGRVFSFYFCSFWPPKPVIPPWALLRGLPVECVCEVRHVIIIEWLEGVLCANICVENVSSFLFLVTICVLENMRWILPTPVISEKMTLFDNDPDDDFLHIILGYYFIDILTIHGNMHIKWKVLTSKKQWYHTHIFPP